MAYVYKQINQNELTITPFQVHKTFTLTNNNANGSYGVYTYQAIHTSSHVNLQDEVESTTANGRTYKFIAHASLYNLYYEDFNNKPMEKQDYYSKYEKRYLHEKATAFSVPQNIFADKIKQSTVEITIGGRTVVEDGFGNLYDSGRKDSVGTLLEDTKPYLLSHIGFNEGYRYKSGTITTGSLEVLPRSTFPPNFRNLQFTDGTYGKKAYFQGSGSQVVIPYTEKFDFGYNDNFFISMMLDVPASQTYLTDSTNIILKKGISGGPYPFSLEVYNTGGDEGKLALKRYDGQTTTTITSSILVNDDVTRHIGLRKTGSVLQLWVDGVIDAEDTIRGGDIINLDNVYVGHNFLGGIDELKIFRSSFSTTQVGNYADLESGSNLNYNVGNVFYETGMVVITSPYSEFAALTGNTGSYSFECRGTRDIEEYEILCQVEGSEFNHTVNTSAATKNTDGMWAYNDIVSNNYFSPYVTQIGLYSDIGELLLVAKLSQAIKIPNDKDLTFVVKFDI